MIFKDSLGFTHHVHEPLLKAGILEPPPGAFRALIDDLTALRDRRRVAERAKVQTIRQRPARPAKPTAQPLRKSLESLAREAQRRTAEIQRRTARALIDDLSAQARAGKLSAIEAAKLDALQHRHARDLGMETTGVRR